MRHRIDYAGTVLLAVGLAAIVLLTTLGGNRSRGSRPRRSGSAILAVAALAPSCASSAARPSRCCRWGCSATACSRSTSAVGFVVGFALFGALTYLPLFQQVVRGQSPTSSGLQLFPLMGGLLIASTLPVS